MFFYPPCYLSAADRNEIGMRRRRLRSLYCHDFPIRSNLLYHKVSGHYVIHTEMLNLDTFYDRHYAVNACLTPLCSVHGLAVTTVEGVGEENAGRRRLHAVQERLAKAHGSQCGFCTPGFVMSMYTLLRSNDKQLPSMSEVATSLQGESIKVF